MIDLPTADWMVMHGDAVPIMSLFWPKLLSRSIVPTAFTVSRIPSPAGAHNKWGTLWFTDLEKTTTLPFGHYAICVKCDAHASPIPLRTTTPDAPATPSGSDTGHLLGRGNMEQIRLQGMASELRAKVGKRLSHVEY